MIFQDNFHGLESYTINLEKKTVFKCIFKKKTTKTSISATCLINQTQIFTFYEKNSLKFLSIFSMLILNY